MYLLKKYITQEARKKSNRKKTPEELDLEDGMVGAVDDDEEEHKVVVSYALTSYKFYKFMYCLNPFLI
jgi:hypothetical protein